MRTVCDKANKCIENVISLVILTFAMEHRVYEAMQSNRKWVLTLNTLLPKTQQNKD